MTATVHNAVAQREEGPGALVVKYRDDFAQVLPSHIRPDTFSRLAQGVLRRDQRLAQAATANPGSFMAALLDCARLGHEPGTPQYSLVAYGREVQGIEGYTGKVERMYRAGAVSSVKAEVVREKDRFDYKPSTMDRPDHEIDWDLDDRGPLRLVYAYAEMKDGSTSRVVVMNRAKVMEHKAVAQGTNRPDSPWNKWEESMWLKTAAHELEKWVPTSSEYLRDQARALGETIRTASRPVSVPPVSPVQPQPQPHTEPVRADVIDSTATDAVAARPSQEQMAKMFATFKDAGLVDKDAQLAYIEQVTGRKVDSRKELTVPDVSAVIDSLGRYIAQQEPSAGES